MFKLDAKWIVLCLVAMCAGACFGSEMPYQDDPAIIKILEGLGDSSATYLPFDKKNKLHQGRRSSDYSMRMVYAPERETALYAGGNHNNGRTNDCWEYHLGSGTWHVLHPSEGGDHYFCKGVVMFGMRARSKAIKDGKKIDTLEQFKAILNERDQKALEKIIPWWKEHMDIRDGMVAMPKGGPFMTSHTWDGLAYDPVGRRMVWSSGAGPNGDADGFHALVMGVPEKEIQAKLDKTHTKMWTFLPEEKKWMRYRKPKAGPCPTFRGMGQSMVWMPDQKKFLWYTAATNVSPDAFEMWTWDPAQDVWAQVKPNGGKSLRDLVLKEKVAPLAEQVMRYSPVRKKVYGFRDGDVFAYDVAKETWSKACTDKRISAHDAHVGIDYDSVNDVFIYTRKEVKNDLVNLAIFNPKANTWEVPEVNGKPLPRPRWGKLKCFFHPIHNVLVVAEGPAPVWVYRYKNAPAK